MKPLSQSDYHNKVPIKVKYRKATVMLSESWRKAIVKLWQRFRNGYRKAVVKVPEVIVNGYRNVMVKLP